MIIALQGRQVFPGLAKLALLHPLSNVPVDKGALGVHQVKLVIETGPGLGDGGGVAEHADGPLHLGQVSARDDGGRLVVDADLEAGGAPVDKLDGALGLDGADGRRDLLGGHITAVEQAAGHVLASAGIALDHLVVGVKAAVGDFRHRELLVVGFFGGDDGSIGHEGKVDAGIGDQIRLELGQVHIQRTVKAERGSNGRDHLRNDAVQIGKSGPLNAQVFAANIINGLKN